MLSLGPSRLVVLSNRGPYATAVVRRRLAVRRNTGGLVTAMEPVLRSQGGVWIAWDDRPPGRPRPPSPPEGRLPFSLRILIDIDESPGRALSPEEEEAGYGGGLGMGWMLDKRIEGLLSTRLMVERDGSLLATHKRVRVARLFGGLRAFLQIDTPQ